MTQRIPLTSLSLTFLFSENPFQLYRNQHTTEVVWEPQSAL